MSAHSQHEAFRFGDFLLDERARSLRRGDQTIRLTAKEFETLIVLVESAGTSVGKQVIMREVWPDTFVSDSSLARNVCVLRKHLGQNAIDTVPKHGYRFALPVETVILHRLPAITPAKMPTADESASGAFPALVVEHVAPLTAVEGKQLAPFRSFWAMVVMILAAYWIGFRLSPTHQQPSKRPFIPAPVRLAVLPFRDLSVPANPDYVTDVLVEELITALGQIDVDRLRVVASSSSTLYRNTSKPADDVARELHADYLVEGTTRLLAPGPDAQVVLTVHLIDGQEQSLLWSNKFTRPLSQMHQMQPDIVKAVAREVQTRVAPGGFAGIASLFW